MKQRWSIVLLITTIIFIVLGMLDKYSSTNIEGNKNVPSKQRFIVSEKLYHTKETKEAALENSEYGWLEYDSWFDFAENYNLPYVDDSTFEIIKAAYAEIDFDGSFEIGDANVYDEYMEIFLKLVHNEVPVLNRETGEESYIKDYNFGGNEYDVNQNIYYFFDADGDGLPELGVKCRTQCYVFKYDTIKDIFVLWYDRQRDIWVGTKKVQWHGNDQYWAFYQLDENGDVECETLILFSRFGEDIYIVMMPKYAEREGEIEITDEMKEQGVYAYRSEQWFFRITEEQYEILSKPYWEAYKSAIEEREDITYTYEELFGPDTQNE